MNFQSFQTNHTNFGTSDFCSVSCGDRVDAIDPTANISTAIVSQSLVWLQAIDSRKPKMSGNSEEALAIKNVKLAKQFDKIKQKLKLVRDKRREDLIKPTNEQIEKKVHQLSRKDVSALFFER